jgi:L-2-hydroxyglutarate oxidase LhgO
MITPDFDVVVVGAGVVGLAVARACTLRDLSVLVLERSALIGAGISSRNSEVIHAGLYYPEASLKSRLCVRGRESLYAYCQARGVSHRRCGKLLVATDVSQHGRLEAISEQARRNAVRDLQWLSAEEARLLEPQLRCTRALLSPSTGIVDAHALMTSLHADLEAHGDGVALRTQFEGAERAAGVFRITTLSGEERCEITSRWLVNSAGLQARAVARSVRGLNPAFIPRTYLAKGHYFSVAGRPFTHLVYPLPADGGLGIHATLQLDGQVRFGPDVEWVETEDYGVSPKRATKFYEEIRRYWPDLSDGALQPAYAGLRPKLSGPGEPPEDFLVSDPAEHGCPGLINLFGIESPGLTACLALGEACVQLMR